jgi:phosphatidylglycerophosphatase A
MKLTQTFFWARLLPKQLVLNLATLGNVGSKSKMPGTIGTIFGFFFYAITFHYFSPITYIFALCIITYLAVAICDTAERHMMQKDPSSIILDEFVAVPFVFLGLNAFNPNVLEAGGWPIYLTGILLFRFFDILKPLGIRMIERFEGGLGCVLDDVVSALVSCFLLHILVLNII